MQHVARGAALNRLLTALQPDGTRLSTLTLLHQGARADLPTLKGLRRSAESPAFKSPIRAERPAKGRFIHAESAADSYRRYLDPL